MKAVRRAAAAILALSAVCTGAWAQSELGVPYTFGDGTQETIRCEYTDSALLPGLPRVDIGLAPASVEVRGGEFFYVRHGWGTWPSECVEAWGWPAMDLQTLTGLLLGTLEFHFRINGATIAPDYIRIDPADGKIGWYVEFPAGSFAPGVYVSEGRWVRHTVDISGCLGAFELPDPEVNGSLLQGFTRVKSCLVSILSP